MKKIIYILLLITSGVSQSMELIDEIKKELGDFVADVQQNQNLQEDIKKIGGDAVELGKDILQNKDIQQDISNLKNDALNVMQEIKNSNTFKNNNLGGSFPHDASGFPVGNTSSLASPTSPSLPSSHSSSPQVPRLNLSSALQRSKSTKDQKTTIRSKEQLAAHIGQAKQTHRQMISESNSQLNGNGKDEIEVNNNNVTVNDPSVQKKKSILPRALNKSDTVIDMDEGMIYTVEYVWNAIQASNLVLYEFAVANNLSLDDVIMYGNLLNDFHVHPEALVEYVKNNCKVKLSTKLVSLGEEKGVDEIKIQKYKKIQEKNPERYKEIVLDVLKAVIAEQDGQLVSSPLNDTHIQMLEKQATNSEGTTRQQWVALAVSTFLTLAGFAWGIYGQVTGTATTAPTHAPTGIPTIPTFPTGSPT